MAGTDKTVPGLPASTTVAGTDLVITDTGSQTRKTTVAQLLSSNLFTQTGTGATARSLNSKLADTVSVKDFGAAGDGTTNDTTAIQNAINSIAVSQSGILYFPPGTYSINATLVATSRRWVFQGSGTLRTEILWNGATNGTAIKFVDDGSTTNTFFAIKNLYVLNNVAIGTTRGILLTSTNSGSNSGQAVIEQVLCQGFSDGLAIGESGGQSSSEISLRNYVGQSCTNGVHIQGANSLNIHFFNCSFAANSIGILASGTHTHFVYGGSCSANTTVDFDFESAGMFTIQNVRSENGVRFLLFAGTSAFTTINLIGNYTTGSNLSVDNAEVKANLGDFFLNAVGNQFRGNFDLNSSTGEATATLIGNGSQQSTLMTTNGDVTYRHFGNYKLASNGTFSAYFPDRTGSQRGGTASDVDTVTWAAGNPTYTSIVKQYVLAKSAAAATAGADTNEDTLATITVPANAIGPNGEVRITTLWTTTNNGNNKTLRVRFSGASGTKYMEQIITTSDTIRAITQFSNRNATNSQVGYVAASGGFGATTGGTVTSAVDTTAQTTVVITGQKASAGDTLTLEQYLVELIPGL